MVIYHLRLLQRVILISVLLNDIILGDAEVAGTSLVIGSLVEVVLLEGSGVDLPLVQEVLGVLVGQQGPQRGGLGQRLGVQPALVLLLLADQPDALLVAQHYVFREEGTILTIIQGILTFWPRFRENRPPCFLGAGKSWAG